LDSGLRTYIRNFKEADVVGDQLLSLTYEDLNSLQIRLVGHQEQIIDAVALLQQLVSIVCVFSLCLCGRSVAFQCD